MSSEKSFLKQYFFGSVFLLLFFCSSDGKTATPVVTTMVIGCSEGEADRTIQTFHSIVGMQFENIGCKSYRKIVTNCYQNNNLLNNYKIKVIVKFSDQLS